MFKIQMPVKSYDFGFVLSLMPLFIARCGRLHLGAANRATSLALLQVVVN